MPTELLSVLKAKEIKAMRSWLDVSKVKKAFMQFHNQSKVMEGGCPIEKQPMCFKSWGIASAREGHCVYLENDFKN